MRVELAREPSVHGERAAVRGLGIAEATEPLEHLGHAAELDLVLALIGEPAALQDLDALAQRRLGADEVAEPRRKPRFPSSYAKVG